MLNMDAGPGARRALLGLVLWAGSAVMACGDDEETNGTGQDGVTSQESGEFMGLLPGSCFLYEFTIPGSGSQSEALVTVEETASFRYPGRNTVVWDQVLTGRGSTTRIFELDGPEVRLLSTIRGQQPRLQRFYEAENVGPDFARFPEPVWMRLIPAVNPDDPPQLDLRGGNAFQTTTTPEIVREDGTDVEMPPQEVHTWRLVQEDAMVDRGALGSFQANEFRYEIARGASSESSTWFLSPDLGFVQFTDFSGIQFRLVDFRVVRGDGSVDGTLSCD